MRVVRYQIIWGNTYMLFGVLFNLLFIVSSIILKDLSIIINIIGGVIIFSIGWGMRKFPYLKYSKNEIQVINYFGSIRKHYTFNKKSEIVIVQNNIYLRTKKLKINKWMTNKGDWNRFLSFYDSEANFMGELLDS